MTPETLEALNTLPAEDAFKTLMRCCGSTRWAKAMAERRPFETVDMLHKVADIEWEVVGREDVLEAFTHHPRIGADIAQLREKYASTASWSSGEQSAVSQAHEDILEALRDGNVAYEKRFGFIFIVCATGKSAEEMLEILNARMPNEPAQELAIAKGEQGKITHLRLEKLEL